MLEDRLKKALTQRTDVPGRVPRFASAPPASATLPERAGGEPFSLAWRDDKLGLRVELREEADGTVWAHAGGSTAADVVVVLGGAGGGERRKERVRLGPTSDGTLEGSVNLGPLAGLRSALGPQIEVSAFLRGPD